MVDGSIIAFDQAINITSTPHRNNSNEPNIHNESNIHNWSNEGCTTPHIKNVNLIHTVQNTTMNHTDSHTGEIPSMITNDIDKHSGDTSDDTMDEEDFMEFMNSYASRLENSDLNRTGEKATMNHTDSHTGEIPPTATNDIDSDKHSGEYSDLNHTEERTTINKNHTVFHTGEKPTTSLEMTNDIDSDKHSGEKPKTKRTLNFSKHSKEKANNNDRNKIEKSKVCSHCGKSYKTNQALQQHIVLKHETEKAKFMNILMPFLHEWLSD